MDIHDYAKLTPDTVLDAVESTGYLSNLRVMALNSYENRVYEVGIEESTPIIAKFYRPNRWTDAQIIEEHEFSLAIQEQEVPIVAPLSIDGETLFEHQGFRFALYPRRGGYAPEFEDLDTLFRLGQQIGRLHNVSKAKPFATRPSLSPTTFGHEARAKVLASGYLPKSLEEAYSTLTAHVLEKVDQYFTANNFTPIRLHGDCHPGNILVRPDSLYFVDLDDARMGPAVQDMWMLLSGETHAKELQFSSFMEGYEEFCEFNYQELRLIESLRSLRLLHYAAWLSSRWEDPAFPMAFPWFNTERYWSEHILELREQMAELDAPPLRKL